MRQVLSLSALIVLFAAGVAWTDEPATNAPYQPEWAALAHPWQDLEVVAPRPVTLATPYYDCRITNCSTTACDCEAGCQPTQAPTVQIIDMCPPGTPRGYSPSADFRARVQAVTGCVVASDTPAGPPMPNLVLPHPLSPPSQPIVACPNGVNQFGEEIEHVLAWRQPSVAYASGFAEVPQCDCPPPNCVLPPPPPSFAGPAAVYSPPVYTAAVPAPFAHPMPYVVAASPSMYPHRVSFPAPPAYTQCSPASCGGQAPCASCYGPGCDCASTGTYHPQVIYPASQCGAATAGNCCVDCADRVEHILEAVHHLDAAGLTADADRLRHQCDAEMRTVVAKLRDAEVEIARLRQAHSDTPTSASFNADTCGHGACNTGEVKSTDTTPSTPKQVMVSVQLMELDRTKCRELGFDFARHDGAGFVGSSLAGLLEKTVPPAGPGDTCRFGTVGNDSAIFPLIETLTKQGALKVLSRPTVMTASGRPACFECGSEIPVTVPSDKGATAVEYRRLGTKVDLVPIVRDDGRIRLEIRARWSELDHSRDLVANDHVIPGIKVREFDTGAELRSGETLVLSGPIDHRDRLCAEVQVPGFIERLPSCITDLPMCDSLVDRLCRRVEEVHVDETEFLAIVRPEIIAPQDHAAAAVTSVKPVSLEHWLSTAAESCKSNCAQPASCDEGPACECANCDCSAEKNCGCSANKLSLEPGCFDQGTTIFAVPVPEQPFTAKMIHVDPAAFTSPIDCPQPFSFDFDSQLPCRPVQFAPTNSSPQRIIQPVVASPLSP